MCGVHLRLNTKASHSIHLISPTSKVSMYMYHMTIVLLNVLGHHLLPLLKDKPNILLLHNFPVGGGETIDIIQDISINYNTFGECLLNDKKKVIMRGIEHQHQRNTESINEAIFERWLDGKGRRPISWSTLVTVLRDVKLHALADQIEGESKRMIVWSTTNHLNDGFNSQ